MDYQPQEVSAIVVRTGDPVLLAAVAAAARLAMATWPSGHTSSFDVDLVEGEGKERDAVMLAIAMYPDPPGVGEPGHRSRHGGSNAGGPTGPGAAINGNAGRACQGLDRV